MADTVKAEPMLAHIVYFSLHDSTPAGRDKLAQACRTLLNDHPGTLYFGVGTPVPDLAREVNDRDFDVALHVVFASRKAHDDYQVAPRHLQFIAENKASWKKVRVFDSYLE